MSHKSKQRLGRGLDSLLPTEIDEFAAKSMPADLKIDESKIRDIEADKITPNPHQPRANFHESELKDLATSIKSHGIVQPLILIEHGGLYQLVAGERRLKAAKLVGLKTVPAIIRSLSEQQQLEIALIENIQRSDLTPLELASAYRKLIDQFNLTVGHIAKQVGSAEPTVSNIMRLLNLTHEAKRALNDGEINLGHTRALLAVTDPDKQILMLKMIIKGNLTVRQAEELSRRFKVDTKDEAPKKIRQTQTYHQQFSKGLAKVLGTKVDIHRTAKGGKVVIEFYSDEELERIYGQIANPNN